MPDKKYRHTYWLKESVDTNDSRKKKKAMLGQLAHEDNISKGEELERLVEKECRERNK